MEHLSIQRKVTIMIAIMAAMLFASVNQTIVGTALPRIIAKLGGMEYYSWVFTIYMLTSSITTILVGRLSDIYGRKPFILIGIGIFVLGSFLSGTSTNILELILYRGIQGLGSGMIMSTSFTAIGDLFSPRERGKWQGLMSGVFGVSSVFGPVLGGYIVDQLEWHWVFWVFLPLGIVAFLMIMMMFPKVEQKEKEPIDAFGSLFLVLTIVPTLLAFSWAGTKYAWTSAPILILFAGAIVSLVIFIFVELKVTATVLTMFLFTNSIFTISNLIGFTLSVGMFGAIMYMPFFIQGVLGQSATHSSYIMIPMTLSLVVGSALSGQIISRTGKYKLLALIGLILTFVGIYMMSKMTAETTTLHTIVNNITVGFGLGISMPVFTLTVQNAVERNFLGVATASSQFVRSLGGTVGVSIMGTVMAQRMASKMSQFTSTLDGSVDPQLMGQFTALMNPQVLLDAAKLEQLRASLPPEAHDLFNQIIVLLRDALGFALEGVFLSGALTMALAIVLALFLQEIPLRGGPEKRKKAEKPAVVEPLLNSKVKT